MRGEDAGQACGRVVAAGSPPHARGRHRPVAQVQESRGITPACAGKTLPHLRCGEGLQDHPRMRGEDASDEFKPAIESGSPPHARGRPDPRRRPERRRRITPACAGKTRSSAAVGIATGDHPRMRGEDTTVWGSNIWKEGSPPHARGRQVDLSRFPGGQGITPACAGKTSASLPRTNLTADHPRMRGEDRKRPRSGGEL